MDKKKQENSKDQSPKIEMIPEGWEVKKIDELCILFDNKRVPLNDDIRQKMQGYIPYYGANGIVDYIDSYIFDENLILLAEDGGNFEEWKIKPIAYKISGKSWVNNHAHVLKNKIGYSLEYIFYKLEHKDITFYISGGTRSKLNQSALRKIVITIPNFLHEQSAIASILSTLDDAIEKTYQLIEKYKRIKQGLMQDLFRYGIDENGQIRSEKTHKFKDSPLGRIPEEWEIVTIGNIANQLSNKNIKNYSYPVLSCSKYRGLVDSLEYFQGRRIYSENLATYKIVKNGSFAYATNHIEEGSIGLQNLYDVALISPMYSVFELSKDIDKLWLFAVLKSEKYRIIYELKTVSTVNRRGSLRWNIFSEINITLPSLSEQSRIASVLSSAEEAIEKEQSYKEKLLALKRGLMEDLLTGKVRISPDLIKEI